MIISFSEEKAIEQEKGRQWYGACESKLEIEVVLYGCWVICARLKAVEPFAKGKNICLPTHKSVLFLTYCIIVSVDNFSYNLSKS